jgi:polyisoprenoid-binding protein YceI
MNPTISLIAALSVVSFAAAKAPMPKAPPANGGIPISVKDSVIKWHGTKVTGEHFGAVRLQSGEIVLKGDEVVGGQFEADMNSISEVEGNKKLEGHLKSADFFEVEKYPTSKFVIKKVSKLKKPEGENTHSVSGNLTIKGKTHPVTFPAKITVSKESAQAKATMKLDRTRWDVRYGSGKFFKGIGDKAIHDEFTLELDLKAPLLKAPGK